MPTILERRWVMARLRLGRVLRGWPLLASLVYTLVPWLRLFPPNATLIYVCACGKRIELDPLDVPLGDTRVLRCRECREKLGPR